MIADPISGVHIGDTVRVLDDAPLGMPGMIGVVINNLGPGDGSHPIAQEVEAELGVPEERLGDRLLLRLDNGVSTGAYSTEVEVINHNHTEVSA